MATQPGDEANLLGMDQTVPLTIKRGIKAFKLRINRWGDLEPEDNQLSRKIIPMCLTELRGIWNQGNKEYLGVKGKWKLIEAPTDGSCGYYCRAVVAGATDLSDRHSWFGLFRG